MSSGSFFTNLTKEGPQIPCAYIGLEGPQGSGKSATGGILALGISIEYCNRAPVVWPDTEGGAGFLQPMFAAEKVDLLQIKTRSVKTLMQSIREAEKIGACVLMPDSLTKFWRTLVKAFMVEKKITTMQQMRPHWTACKEPWFDLMDMLLDTKLHKIICGRGGFEFEDIDVLNDDGEVVATDSVRGAHKMKAEGETGHEPDILIHMQSMIDPDAPATMKQKRGKRGRIEVAAPRKIHVATLEKGRVWAMNAKVFKFADRDKYKPGEYKEVLECFAPYFKMISFGGAARPANADMSDVFRRDGQSQYSNQQTQKQIAIEEWDAVFNIILPGRTAKENNLRALIGREIAAGILSRTAFERQSLDDLRFQVLTLKKLLLRVEKTPAILDLDKKDGLLSEIESARKEAGFEWQQLKGQPNGAGQPIVNAMEQADPMEVF